MNTYEKLFPYGPLGLPPKEDVPSSAEQALQMYDVQCAIKSYNRAEIREVLADLPTKTLQDLYAELTDLMA